MTAPTEPLEQARELARLRRRVADLEDQLADMRDQRDAARVTVAQQQTEFQAWRLRPNPCEPRTQTVPTGDHL